MAASTDQIQGNVALPKVKVGDVLIPELIEPAVPEGSTDSIEFTHTDLTDNHRTHKHGWSDGGEVTHVHNYTEAAYSQALALIEDDTLAWTVEWTDPTQTVTDPKIAFTGHITTHPTISMPLDDRLTFSYGVKVTGAVAFTEGTSV